MISAPNRLKAVELITEAISAGATATKACRELRLSLRTYQRWTQGKNIKVDGRPGAEHVDPVNKLSDDERQLILEICNQEAYRSLPPSQIVPAMALRLHYCPAGYALDRWDLNLIISSHPLGNNNQFHPILRESRGTGFISARAATGSQVLCYFSRL